MQNIPVFQAAAARLAATCDQAAMVLADIEAANREFLIPRSEFNDDDLYCYDLATLELDHVIGASAPRAFRYVPPVGLQAERGLTAKRRGIWRYAQTQKERDAADNEAAERDYQRRQERASS
jgi:hypothetical protein